jgi:hypothetical protein
MKQIERGIIVALLLVATLSGCAMTSVRQHPDFANGERKIKVVAILPSEVEFRHLVFTGENERDPEREKSIASEIESGMATALQGRGYAAKMDVIEKSQSGDKEFNFQLEQFRSAYVQASKELYARAMVEEDESTKFKVGVGPIANPFAAVAGADALMIASYQGFDKSSGLMAKEITTSVLLAALTGVYYGPAQSGGRIELSLIDGVSGNVLWSNASAGPVSAYATLSSATAPLPILAGAGDTKAASGNPIPGSAGTIGETPPAAAEVPPAAVDTTAAASTAHPNSTTDKSLASANQSQPAGAMP